MKKHTKWRWSNFSKADYITLNKYVITDFCFYHKDYSKVFWENMRHSFNYVKLVNKFIFLIN